MGRQLKDSIYTKSDEFRKKQEAQNLIKFVETAPELYGNWYWQNTLRYTADKPKYLLEIVRRPDSEGFPLPIAALQPKVNVALTKSQLYNAFVDGLKDVSVKGRRLLTSQVMTRQKLRFMEEETPSVAEFIGKKRYPKIR